MIIDDKTKIKLGWVIALIGLLIPATLGFSSYLDQHVDARITPLIEMVKEMKQDIKEIQLDIRKIERKK